MGRVNGAQVNSAVAPRNNDEFDNPFDGSNTEVDEPEAPAQANGNAQADASRRRRSPIERLIASILRAPDNMSQEDLGREVEARFKELESIQQESGRQAVVTERAVAHSDILKKKVKALKRQLLELALNVDED